MLWRGLMRLQILALCFVGATATASADSGIRLEVHGQHRLVYRYSDPVALGVPSANGPALARASESLQLLRNTLELDVQWSPELRSVLQVGGWYAFGEERLAQPPDADLGDVALAFAEWTGERMRVRVGRQELPLGTTRWFSTRDGANVRQSLDLLRMSFALRRASLDVFGGLVPQLRRGWFDDRPNAKAQLVGAYATIVLAKVLSLDAYTLYRKRDGAPFAGERRLTFGFSAGGETAWGAEYIQHTLLQVGDSLLAWGLSAAFWQRLPFQIVRIGLRLDALSGAKGAHGGTFDPLFPNQTFFSPHPAIYPANLYSVHPMFTLTPGKLELEAGCIVLWRQSVHDAIYESNAAITAVQGLPQRAYTGAQLSVRLSYEIDEHFETEAVFSRLFAGAAIDGAGGTDVDFFGSTISFRY